MARSCEFKLKMIQTPDGNKHGQTPLKRAYTWHRRTHAALPVGHLPDNECDSAVGINDTIERAVSATAKQVQ
jgi:hypothetical protein